MITTISQAEQDFKDTRIAQSIAAGHMRRAQTADAPAAEQAYKEARDAADRAREIYYGMLLRTAE